MNTLNKTLALIKHGIPVETLEKISESGINKLYDLLLNEQVTPSKTGTISMKKTDTETAKNLAKSGFNVKLEGEVEEKKEKKNPWAICTAQLGKEFGTTERSEWSKKQTQKYERCVMDVKKGIKENKNPIEVFAKNEAERFIEAHIKPKIKKG